MKRMQKIEQLTMLAGFSPTELSRVSNKVLEKTYQAALPLIREKQDEIARVMARENKHSFAKREKMANEQIQRNLELSWSRTWRHPKEVAIPSPAPAQPVEELSDAEMCAHLAQVAEGKRKEAARLYQSTGDLAYAEKANRSMMERNAYAESAKMLEAELA